MTVDRAVAGPAALSGPALRERARASTGAAVRWHWLYDARTDALLTWCWVPFFLVGLAISTHHGAAADRALGRLLTGVLLVSLLHQPLTLLLVYGDAGQFRLRRRLFTWAPPIALVTIAVGVGLNLWLLVPVAAIWNAVHTLQQRYGLLRIHARKSGYGNARLDRAVLSCRSPPSSPLPPRCPAPPTRSTGWPRSSAVGRTPMLRISSRRRRARCWSSPCPWSWRRWRC